MPNSSEAGREKVKAILACFRKGALMLAEIRREQSAGKGIPGKSSATPKQQ